MGEDYSGTNTISSSEGMQDGFVAELIWILKGLLYPCWSGSFYRATARRRLIFALIFFLLFAFLLTSISTIRIALSMSEFGTEIETAFERGEFPTITIREGIAFVDGPQPLVIVDEGRSFFAIDTSGKYQQIDLSRYSQGFLLTRTSLHVLDDREYRQMPLNELHEVFGDPIVLDESQVLQIWDAVSLFINWIVFIGLSLWNSLIRFAHIAITGLVIWGIISIKRSGTSFGPILITGIYANVPAIYGHFLLGLIGFAFLGSYSILLIIIWAIALRVIFKEPRLEDITKENGGEGYVSTKQTG